MAPHPATITRQILLAVLFPVLILTIGLSAYYSYARYQDLEVAGWEIGQAISNDLAQAAELAFYADNQRSLRKLARATVSRPAIDTVLFLDREGQILAQRGDKQALATLPELSRDTLTSAMLDNHMVLARPILSSAIDIGDFEFAEGRAPAEAETLGWVVLALSRDSIFGRSTQILRDASIIALLGLMAGALFAVRTGARIGRPARALTRHVEQLDQKGGTLFIEPRGSKETVILAQVVNRLTESIRDQLEERDRAIAKATAELTARNKTLTETSQTLEFALQAKDEFLARMSHELRTPLTTIIGFNRLLDSTATGEQASEYRDHIEHASTLLHSIIDDILDYSRLQTGSFELEKVEFSLTDCFENVVGMHGAEAVEKRLELVLLIDNDVPQRIIGDSHRLQQVVNNLLANALKFTEHGEIIVQLMVQLLDDSTARLDCEIRDTGIGIAPEDQRRLFQPFNQADNSITRQYGGSGLGLAISRSLVEKMGGQMELQSEPNKGTNIKFHFLADLPAHAIAQQLNPTTGGTILAYDHNPWSRRALRAALLNSSHDVSVYADRSRFARECEQCDASTLVVLSLCYEEAQMQTLSAWLRELRTHFQGGIVVLSPNPEAAGQLQSQGISTQAMGFTLKPLRQARLVQLIHRLSHPSAHSTPDEPPNTPLQGLHILVAEDHSLIRELVEKILSQAGAIVETVADGEQAVQACLSGNYAIAFIDLHMPHMDGLEATRTIRARTINLPIVCLTADITAQQRSELYDAGANAVLLKPINENQLIALIREHCDVTDLPNHDLRDSGQTHLAEQANPRQAELTKCLLDLVHRARGALEQSAHEEYHAALHDILGLAGMYQLTTLHELIKQMKQAGFELSNEEARHLFDEAESLILKD